MSRGEHETLPPVEAKRLPLITNSAAKTFRLCQRLFQLRYVLGYRPVADAAALRFGTTAHAGLEAWTQLDGAYGDERLATMLAAVQPPPGAEVDPIAQVVIEELLRGYHYRWIDEPVRTVFVEKQFDAELVNPATGAASRTYRLGGKIDGGVEVLAPLSCGAAAGESLLLEHKTTSDDIGLGSSYWQRLRIDSQVSTYFVGAESFGFKAAGCLYDVIRKPAMRPASVPLTDEDGVKIVLDAVGARVRTKDGKKWRESGSTADGYTLQTRPETPEEFRARLRADIAENPDRYYQRGFVVRLEEELRDGMFDTWQTARLIREAELANRYPRNPDACVRYSRPCDFFGVCTGAASLEDPMKFRRADTAHEELAVPTPTPTSTRAPACADGPPLPF
jgi:hypothetical protein